jgi:hypothetical protein
MDLSEVPFSLMHVGRTIPVTPDCPAVATHPGFEQQAFCFSWFSAFGSHVMRSLQRFIFLVHGLISRHFFFISVVKSGLISDIEQLYPGSTSCPIAW